MTALHSIHANLLDLVLAVTTCVEKRWAAPALILVYSGIDILSALSSPDGRASRARFVEWVDQYLLPASGLEDCRSIDLYAARCGLLHTMAAASGLSRRGDAKPITYAFGNANVNDLRRSNRLAGRDALAILVEDLVLAFGEAADRFADDVATDAGLAEEVQSRLRKVFAKLELKDLGILESDAS